MIKKPVQVIFNLILIYIYRTLQYFLVLIKWILTQNDDVDNLITELAGPTNIGYQLFHGKSEGYKSQSSSSDRDKSPDPSEDFDFWNPHKELVYGKKASRRIDTYDEVSHYLNDLTAILSTDLLKQWEEMNCDFLDMYEQQASKWFFLMKDLVKLRRLLDLVTKFPIFGISAGSKMSIKHLGHGSVEPSISEGEIRLYSMRFCPFAHRVHLTLNAKKIKYNPVFINLSEKPEWYLKKFPDGKVPALLYKGEFLHESLLVADFLDEQYPEPPLYPKDPLDKIKDKLLIDKFSRITVSFYILAMKGFEEHNFTKFLTELKDFENELAKRGKIYFGGDAPNMVDYMIWPWFERFGVFPILAGDDKYKIPGGDYPKLMNWIKLMEKQDAVVKHYLASDVHAKHFKLRKEESPAAFDIL